MASFPPIISAGPPVEILTSASLLEALSGAINEEEPFDLDREAESDLEQEIEATTDELLAALNPQLRSVWIGAKKALHSANPDYGRHVVFNNKKLFLW